MKPQLYDGDDDLNEYLAQFEMLAENKGVIMSNVQHDVKQLATLPSHIENVY
jgi:hypothetical protein